MTPAIVEKRIASGMSASATTMPEHVATDFGELLLTVV